MNEPRLRDWIAHLMAVSGPHLVHDAPLGLGPMEAAFRAAMSPPLPAPPSPHLSEPPTSPAVVEGAVGSDREIGLWWALTDERIGVDSIIDVDAEGSLLVVDAFRTVEVWTDAELSALHALWRLAIDRKREDWKRRLDRAVAWHLIHTQPDNATNRPWALHVFLLADQPETIHYAETLLHNCQTFTGKPDPLSAWILHDAAREIERFLA